MRRIPFFVVLVVLAAVVAVGPARAREGPPVGVGVAYAGLYLTGEVDPAVLDATAAWAGKRATFGGLFHHLNENNSFSDQDRYRRYTIWLLDRVWAAQATPFSNVEISYRASQLASGAHDAEIRAWAGMVRDWLDGDSVVDPAPPTVGRSLIIAPLQEMNGSWTPYGCYPSPAGAAPVVEAEGYRQAFRRFVTIARQELGDAAVRVRWAFAPNNVSSPGCGSIAAYYPGDDVVDLVGISAFNFGTAVSGGTWESPAEAVIPAVNEIRATVTADRPFLLAQTGSASAGGDKDAWIRELLRLVIDDPNLEGLVWFNTDKFEPGGFVDWACCPDRNPGWRDAVQDPAVRYAWPLEEWFAPGPIPFVRVDRAPVAAPDTARVTRARSVTIDVTANDADPDGFPLRPEVVDAPGHGTLEVLDDGRVRYAHDGSAAPTDSFTYRASDGTLTSGIVAVTITVVPAAEGVGMVDPTTGRWFLRTAAGTSSFYFGVPGDLPVAGDWNCDGIATPGLYRRSDGYVYLRDSNTQGVADRRFYVGVPGDLPLAGDFDGNGCDTISVFRPSEGKVYVVDQLGANDGGLPPASRTFYYGTAGDSLFTGDFDGDGIDSVAVYRDGVVYVRNTLTDGPADTSFTYGAPGDRPVAGDWTGKGIDTVGVVRDPEARFYLRSFNSAGPATRVFYFGEPGWVPVSGDFGPAG